MSLARVLRPLALSLACAAGTAAASAWTPVELGASVRAASPRLVARADRTAAFSLDAAALGARLGAAAGGRPEILLPLPDGSLAPLRAEESSIMEPELQARFPSIRSYALTGEDAVGRATWTPSGLDAIVVSGGRVLRVAPLPASASTGPGIPHLAWVESDLLDGSNLTCGAGAAGPIALPPGGAPTPALASGIVRYTYRLAVATTGEYYAARGGSDATVLASIVTEFDRVNLLYGMELGIRFTIVDETTDLFYTDPVADPYTDGTPCTMRGEAQADIPAVIGDAAFDVGHVLGAVPAGGCAGGSNVCTAAKANGASTLRTDAAHPAGHEDFGGYRLIMHELAHQFGAGHTWNAAVGGNCTPAQYSPSSAVEPDSGTTIMSYLGTCGASDLGSGPAEPYFHVFSHDQVLSFVTAGGGDSCAAIAASGNAIPVVDAGPDRTIPRGTPFTLEGSATDGDGDDLLFAWEQVDLGVAQLPPGTDDGQSPLFRSFTPSAGGNVRTFPQWSDVLSGGSTMGETLPTTDRVMTFALSARDGRSTGGVDSDTMVVTTSGAPFRVIAPAAGASLEAGCDATVDWIVGSAAQHATEARILLSTDGGLAFDTVLGQVPIDAPPAVVTLPCDLSSNARIKVEAVGNVFFDVNPGPFEVVAVPPVVVVTAQGGDADGSCERLIAFEATVTDSCSAPAADVVVTAHLLEGAATVGDPVFVAQQQDDATVLVTGTVLVSDLVDCPAEIAIEVSGRDGCGHGAFAEDVAIVTDATPPLLAGAPADDTVECDAVPAPALVTATDACDEEPALDFAEQETPGDCPGESTIVRTWTATDQCGNETSAQQVLQVVDTTPPVVTETDDDLRCLWPPNHALRCFTKADFSPEIADACSPPLAWRFVDCASDQPEGQGDGNADPDCVVSEDGQGFCVRAEREGGDPAGRRYAVTIEATDACGNTSEWAVIGHVLVPRAKKPGCGS